MSSPDVGREIEQMITVRDVEVLSQRTPTCCGLEESAMKRLLQVFGLIVAALLAPGVSRGQTDTVTGDSPFRFQLEESMGPRGRAVEGYVYNGLPWRITNVQLRVESVDAGGAVIAFASGWVLGDVPAGGRAYFYIPVTTPAPTYRPSVQAFDKLTLESLQAP